MKCKSCGANYKTKELKCPYCGRVNALGLIWQKERSEAELEYLNAKDAAHKKIFSLYTLNRLLNRFLLIVALLIILEIIFVIGFVSIYFGVYKPKHKFSDKTVSTMKEYYDNQDYAKLYIFMSDNELFSKYYFAYTQAALMYQSFEEYTRYRLNFTIACEKGKLDEVKDYEISSLLDHALELYNHDIGIYDDYDDDNKAIYENYQDKIYTFFIGTLHFTKDEADVFFSNDYIKSDEMEQYVSLIRQRGGTNEQ